MSTPLRVLILEDQPADAELMLHELRQADYDPDWQRVETEADYLSGLKPTLDLILADYNLPQYDAMRALRRHQEQGIDVPFIVVTGSISEEVAVECMKQGATDYLLKDRMSRLGPAVAQAMEKRRLREVARKAEELLRLQSSVMEAAANAIMITDRDGCIAWVNPAFTRLTGYSLTKAWGQNPRFLKSDRQDDSVYRTLWETISSGRVWTGELVNRRKDGSLYTEEMTITPVLDLQGAVSHFIAIKQDITARKHAEERIVRLNRSLRTISLCNQVLVRVMEEEGLLREICRTIVDVGGHRVAWVGLVDEGTDYFLRPAAVVGCEPERVDRHAVNLADSAWETCPVVLAIRTGMSQVVRNIPANPACCPWHNEALGLGIGSSISLPLKEGERRFGALTIYSALLDAFDAEEVGLLAELADDLSYGIQTIRTRAAHQRALTEIESLARFPQENPTPVLRVRADGTVLYANAPSEPLLRLWGTAVGDRMPAEWSARIRYTLETRTQQTIDLSGESRVYSCVMAPVPEGGYVNLYGRDITERKRAQEALAERIRQLEAVRETGEEITRELDLSKLLGLIMQRAVELTGAASGVVSLWDEMEKVLTPRAWHGLGEWLRRVRPRLGEGVTGTVAARREGMIVNDYPASPYVMPDFLEHSQITAIVAEPLLYRERLVGVITLSNEGSPRIFTEDDQYILRLIATQAAIAIENARLYEEVKRHAEELERRVGERTAELEAANQKLAAASRHKSEFLANMSHELRTPLNAVIGFSELLQEQRVGPLNEKQARYVSHIATGGKHLVQLIGDILDLSKVEAGKFILQPEPLPVAQILEDILVIGRGLANQKSQEIQVEIPPDLPPLVADPVRFKQILFNLLSNAVKFTPNNGRITVRAQRVPAISDCRFPIADLKETGLPPQSEIANLKSKIGDFLEIAVTDTGIGIRAEDLPRLFQEFVQLERTHKERQEGTGLGLALTKRLVELHGGCIRAESPGEGQGSTFTVVLPFGGPSDRGTE